MLHISIKAYGTLAKRLGRDDGEIYILPFTAPQSLMSILRELEIPQGEVGFASFNNVLITTEQEIAGDGELMLVNHIGGG